MVIPCCSFIPAKIEITLSRKKQDKALIVARECINNKKIAKAIKKQCIPFGLIADLSPTGDDTLFNEFKKPQVQLVRS